MKSSYRVAIASEGGNAGAEEQDTEKDKKDHGQKGTRKKVVKRIVKRVIASASGAKAEGPKDAKIVKSPAIVDAANQKAATENQGSSSSVKKVYLSELPTERHTTKENIETFFKPETYQKGGPTPAPAAEVSTSEPGATRPVSPEVSESTMPESGEKPPIEPPCVDKPVDDVEETKTNDDEQIEDTEKQTEETKADNEQENTKKEQTEDTQELPHDQGKAHDDGTEVPKTTELAPVETEEKEMQVENELQEGNEGKDEEKTNQCTETPEDTNEEWNSDRWYSWNSYNNWNWNSWNSWGWWTNTESPNQEWSGKKGHLTTPESALTRLASTDSFEKCLGRASTMDIENAQDDRESPAGENANTESNTEKTGHAEPKKVDAEPEETKKELAKKKAHARYMRYYRSVHESRDLNIKRFVFIIKCICKYFLR